MNHASTFQYLKFGPPGSKFSLCWSAKYRMKFFKRKKCSQKKEMASATNSSKPVDLKFGSLHQVESILEWDHHLQQLKGAENRPVAQKRWYRRSENYRPVFINCLRESWQISLQGFQMNETESKLKFEKIRTLWMTFSPWTSWWNVQESTDTTRLLFVRFKKHRRSWVAYRAVNSCRERDWWKLYVSE